MAGGALKHALPGWDGKLAARPADHRAPRDAWSVQAPGVVNGQIPRSFNSRNTISGSQRQIFHQMFPESRFRNRGVKFWPIDPST